MATNDYRSLRELTNQQLLALETLMAGGTHAEAAEHAGVHRVTVSNWARGHPAFLAEMNRRQLERCEQRVKRLRELDEAALAGVAAQLETNDPEFALKWLKLRGLETPAPTGPTDPEELIEREVRRQRQQAQQATSERSFDPPDLDLEALQQEVEERLSHAYD